MNSKRLLKGILTLFFSILLLDSYGTHIRAGEILAENINNSFLQWRFTVILYTDLSSPVESRTVDINFGDNSPTKTIRRDSFIDIGNGIGVNYFDTVHTFPSGTGVTYCVSVVDENRNANVLNFDNSVNTAFYVETKVVIDQAAGLNSSPRFTQIPVVNAAFGQKWVFDNGGYDPDGDSVSFEMSVPKMGGGFDVVNYRDPDVVAGGLTEDGTGPAFFQLDPVTGVMTWDAPNLNGLYNVAFKIIEWRKNPITGQFLQLGSVTRDMQIIVKGRANRRPLIFVPNDTCVIAGNRLEFRVIGVDQDSIPDQVILSASGEPFELQISPATYSPPNNPPQNSPGSLLFQWNTVCDHVRKREYRATFRVDDNVDPDNQLTDFGDVNITVIAPPPELDTAIVGANFIDLQWQPYNCGLANRFEIYRKIGPSSDPDTSGSCLTGPLTGYELIANVPLNSTTYRDNDNGNGLLKGPEYCYIIVATLPDGAKSKSSNEVCATLELNVPFLTKVDIESTSNNGSVNVAWARPSEIDSTIYSPSYRYELYRGILGNEQLVFSSTNLDDTTFLDQGLNTVDTFIDYRIEFFTHGGDSLQVPVSQASSVFLTSVPGGQRVELTWSAVVPWSLDDLYHYIFREDSGQFVMIDSVLVVDGIMNYTDWGAYQNIKLVNGEEYCYYVETRGSYFSDKYPAILSNRSQIKCETPRDSIPPCPPTLFTNSVNCDSLYSNLNCSSNPNDIPNPNKNEIWWEPDLSQGCDTEIAFYKIYIKRRSGSPFEFLDQTTDTFYVHNSANLANCYVVTAVDSFNNESDFSNVACYDNCPYFRLPNTFTPNGDGENQTFRACPVPRFVEEVIFTVYNRWGEKIRVITDDININWDGLDDGGKLVPAGDYYYDARVRFARLNEEDELEQFKGYIYISY